VWVSFDAGEHWESLQLNLPHSSMRDLWIHDDDLIVATHGRSLWILDDITRLRQLPPAALHQAMLFRPAAAYRMQRSTWTDTPIPPDEPLASNPPPGAIIEYFLPRDARGTVTLEVFDSHSELVRRYRSDDPQEPSAAQLARELIPQYWIKPPRVLPASGGMHRWVWDLRYGAPLSVTRGYPISAVPHATPQGPEGPVALPGNYLVRLTFDGHRFEAPLTVSPDPRVHLPAGALEEQLQLARQLAALLTESSRTVLTARSEQAQLKALAPTAPVAAAADAYAGRLAALLESAKEKPTAATPESPPQAAAEPQGRQAESAPGTLLTDVQQHIAELYAAVTRGDGAPTAAQLRAAADVQQELAALMTRWQQLQAELPELNSRLRAAKLAAIRADLAPPRDLNVADED